VALADASGAPKAVDRYCAERGLRLAAQRASDPSAQRAHVWLLESAARGASQKPISIEQFR
jgi:hypothetical protein